MKVAPPAAPPPVSLAAPVPYPRAEVGSYMSIGGREGRVARVMAPHRQPPEQARLTCPPPAKGTRLYETAEAATAHIAQVLPHLVDGLRELRLTDSKYVTQRRQAPQNEPVSAYSPESWASASHSSSFTTYTVEEATFAHLTLAAKFRRGVRGDDTATMHELVSAVDLLGADLLATAPRQIIVRVGALSVGLSWCALVPDLWRHCR